MDAISVSHGLRLPGRVIRDDAQSPAEMPTSDAVKKFKLGNASDEQQ